jgi:hypothetical protein
MASENGRASGCTPTSASKQSLKVDICRIAQSQLFHPLTTWGSMHAFVWTWLTISWFIACMILMADMIFDHRCQLTPDLNHYCFHTCNILDPNIFSPNKCINAVSKCLYSCSALYLPRGKNSSSFTQPSEDPKSLTIFQPAKSVWEFRSILKMPNPAEIVLENRQVNPSRGIDA